MAVECGNGNENVYRQVVQSFTGLYGCPPDAVVRAPGRVNLIGEHTDYNDGFVLPMAIDRGVWIALRPCADGRVKLRSLQVPDPVDFALDDDRRGTGWGEYVRGVAWALREAGKSLRGCEGVVASDLPIGAGLSSSAALELASARAFAWVSALTWDPLEVARLGQRAENDWVGVSCGIMDQLASAAGVDGHALLIDCRTLGLDAVPLPPEAAVVILDTGTRRGLVDSAYNERRQHCHDAARLLGVAALRDVDAGRFSQLEQGLDEVTRKRARHVVFENARALEAAAALRRVDAGTFGRLMNASHRSLRDDFEVSSPALDAMVECAQQRRACFGARMTGAGFGGCAVALVTAEASVHFGAQVSACYEARTGMKAQTYVCRATDGAEVVVPR